MPSTTCLAQFTSPPDSTVLAHGMNKGGWPVSGEEFACWTSLLICAIVLQQCLSFYVVVEHATVAGLPQNSLGEYWGIGSGANQTVPKVRGKSDCVRALLTSSRERRRRSSHAFVGFAQPSSKRAE
jgi:hypothetical protein